MAKKETRAATHGTDKLIIVPDSCTLNNATSIIPEHFFIEKGRGGYVEPEKRPEHFYDIYKNFLPRDKIQGIHVLDVIGAETFGRLSDGSYYDESFRIADFKANAHLKPLSDAVYNNKDNFVKIVKTTHGQALLKIFSGFFKLQENINDYLGSLTPGNPTREKGDEVAKKLSKAFKILKSNKGEEIIKEYVLHHNNPVYFVSDDQRGRETVIRASADNQKAPIYVSNTFGLLEKMMGYSYDRDKKRYYDEDRNILFKCCGIRSNVTPEEIIDVMYKARAKKEGREFKEEEIRKFKTHHFVSIVEHAPGAKKPKVIRPVEASFTTTPTR